MKKCYIFLFLMFCLRAHAALPDSIAMQNNVRDKILDEIRLTLESRNKVLDSAINIMDSKVTKLDSAIKTTGNPRERMDKLVERVQVLEAKQKAVEENELNVYEANYQSAIINLVSMDREIKPLLLFHTTRDFFNALSEASNPMNYEGFRPGFEKFRQYVERTKSRNATLNSVSEVVSATGSISFGIPLVGAYSQLLFSGMASYVNSIGHRRRELKAEAEKMFAITTTLSQFSTDKNIIENGWDDITRSLSEMQVYYDSTLNCNLRMVDIPKAEMIDRFTRENDANKRYEYLTYLRHNALEYVRKLKDNNPKDWKEMIYYQLMDVQSLKQRYGDLTYNIREHIDRYDVLFTKYKNNKNIGEHISKLDQKLNQLKATFDETFEPSQYAHAAKQMYKVM